MKTLQHTVAAIAMTLFPAIAGAQASIEWDRPSHDFGVFYEDDGVVGCQFTYRNTGTEPLVIISARSSCGCTTPGYDRRAIAPGDSASLTVRYDPASRPGRFTKKIYIETNTTPSRSTLLISGTTIGSDASVAARFPVDFGKMKFQRNAILFGQVRKGKVQTVFLDAYNRSPDSIAPTVTSKPEYIDIKTVPEKVAPGEQLSFVAYLRSGQCDTFGALDDTVTISTGSKELIHLPVIATINEDFSNLTEKQLKKAPVAHIEDKRVDFGTLDPKNGNALTRTFEIANIGKSQLKIHRVYTSSPAVTISVDKKQIKPGKKSAVTVSVTPSALPGAIFNTAITVITNDPLSPTQTIRATGIIKQ